MMGWIGNAFLVMGLYGITSKTPRRGAFLFSIVGEVVYIIRSIVVHDWALVAICVIFCGMAVRGYRNWSN